MKEFIRSRQEILFLAIENSPNSVIITDGLGQILYANQTFQLLTGYTEEDLAYSSLETIRAPGNLSTQEDLKALKTLKRGQSIVNVYHNSKADGSIYIVKSKITPVFIEEEQRDYILFIEEDISTKMDFEKELVSAKLSAKNFEKSKKEFLSIISHELRTPLNAIIGLSSLLNSESEISGEGKRSLDAILSSSNNLLKMLNSVLEVSNTNLGSFQLKMRNFDVRYELMSLTREYQLRCHEGQKLSIHFDPTLPAALYGDALRLKQILENILDNALKFTPKGVIEIDCDLLKRDEENCELQISIKDTGVGIPQDKLEMIFDLFAQADSSYTREHGGIGLGLSIAKRLVSLMDGEIMAMPNDSEGTSFVFTVKMHVGDISALRTHLDERTVQSIKGLKILIAEDNILNQKLMRRLLNAGEAKVMFADNGLEACNMLLAHPVDVVVMDLYMPEMNGIDATLQIRKNPVYASVKDTPIIALTSVNDPAVYVKAMNAGMDDYVIKPARKNILYNLLHHYGQAYQVRLDKAQDDSEVE